jgi:uncharacterized SAM-binding protein YcdF (DUF218 family)
MIPPQLKEFLVPGTYAFFLAALFFGVLLLYRKKDHGRTGRRALTSLFLLYWVLSTPIASVALVEALTSDYPPVQTRAGARGATAIVVLSAGMYTHRSRGDLFETATREGSLRVVEAARVYRILDRPWVIVSGAWGSERHSEAGFMQEQLKSVGIPGDRIVREDLAVNTREHGIYIPPLLRERGVNQFVLVTSRPHMDRALKIFRVAGFEPVPSSPEVYRRRPGSVDRYLPSTTALSISEQVIYDKLATVYYWLRGWL